MRHTITLILDDEEPIDKLCADVAQTLDEEFDLVSCKPAPAITLQEPKPTDKNKPK